MPRSILVADSNPTQRITLKVRLEQAGYRVEAAAESGRAAALLRARRVDLAVIDADLDGGGIEAVMPGPGGVPVIALAPCARRVAALACGAVDVLSRPADEQMLLARIRRALAATPDPVTELAEGATPFDAMPLPAEVALVAPDPASGQRWKAALGRPGLSLRVETPEAVLARTAAGEAVDAYLIGSTLADGGDGLRLLSELRARPASAGAAVIVVLPPEQTARAATALDLGAWDVVCRAPGEDWPREVRLRLEAQLAAKRRADVDRDRLARERLWALTDPLTGLHNRRLAMPRLAEMLDATERCRDGVLAVLALDLDRFKRINDGHGHAAGDAVLTAVAQRLAGALDADALLARMGGEEFMVAVPLQDPRDCWRLAERLRRAVSDQPVVLPAALGGRQLPVTVSIGIARHHAGTGLAPDTRERLLHRADLALFSAKAAGRDRIVEAPVEAAA